MHVSTKRIAFLGLLLALTVLCPVLGSMIETATLFFLAAGSYLVGVAVIETGYRYGSLFYLASVFLSFLLAPNKLYCLTFAMMGLYLLLTQAGKRWFQNRQLKRLATLSHGQVQLSSGKKALWIMKAIVFNVIFIPFLLFAPELFYAGALSSKIVILLLIGGEVIFIFYDLAFDQFIAKYWLRVRKQIRF